MRMVGIPYLKYQCLVLWRKWRMPQMLPMLPPMIAVKKREASEMRQAPRIALLLSIPIWTYPMKLTITKYMMKINSISINTPSYPDMYRKLD